MNFNSKIILLVIISLNYYPRILSINFNNFFAPENYSAISKALNDVVDVFIREEKIATEILIIEYRLSDRSYGVFQNLVTQNDKKIDYFIRSDLILECKNMTFGTNLIVFLRATMHNLWCYQKYYKFYGVHTTAKVIIHIDDLSLKSVMESGMNLRKLGLFSDGSYTRTYFVVNELDKIYLTTFEWFSKQTCNMPHFKVLNEFNKSTGKWRRKLKKHAKFMNYHGCELVLFTPSQRSTPFSLHSWGYSKVNDFRTNFTVHGTVPELFKIASSKFNFKAEFQPVHVYLNQSFLQYYDLDYVRIVEINQKYKQPMVCIEFSSFLSHYRTEVVGTYPFMESVLYLLVTPAEEYTPYEKLLLPFDEETWILLAVTFTLAFCSIIIINKLSRKVQNVFYGSRVKTPLLNLTSIFFGISQTQLPSGNFSRQILIIFVYFCLIFRTCFQSKMFEFMTSHPRHAPPKTLQDLVDRNYTAYTESRKKTIETLIADEINLWPQLQEIREEQFKNIYYTQSRNATAKIALIIQNIYRTIEMYKSKKDDGWMRLNDDNLVVVHGTFAMNSYSFYFNMIAKTVHGLIDTGVLKHLADRHLGVLPKFPKYTDDPEVLTLEDLEFGFNIWLGFCATSIVCFIIELIIFKLRIWCRKPKSRKCFEYAKIGPSKVNHKVDIRLNKKTLEKFRVRKVKSSNEDQTKDTEQDDGNNQNSVPEQNQSQIPSTSKEVTANETGDFADIMRLVDIDIDEN